MLSYFITSFLTLSGKQIAFKQMLDMTNIEHALTTNLTCVFLNTFCLSEEMKIKCIAIIQKQII